jgi:hypothetical protein
MKANGHSTPVTIGIQEGEKSMKMHKLSVKPICIVLCIAGFSAFTVSAAVMAE